MTEWEQIAAWYRTLDLEPGAPAEDVKAAWRDLVKIWHPDRFASEPHLERRCQEKLKQINEAYEQLQARGGELLLYKPPDYARCHRCGRRDVEPENLFCEECIEAMEGPEAPPVARPSGWSRHWVSALLGAGMVAAVVLHLTIDGLENTFVYLFVLLAGFVVLRQVYHSL